MPSLSTFVHCLFVFHSLFIHCLLIYHSLMYCLFLYGSFIYCLFIIVCSFIVCSFVVVHLLFIHHRSLSSFVPPYRLSFIVCLFVHRCLFVHCMVVQRLFVVRFVISWPISVIVNARSQLKHAKRDKLEGDNDGGSRWRW